MVSTLGAPPPELTPLQIGPPKTKVSSGVGGIGEVKGGEVKGGG